MNFRNSRPFWLLSLVMLVGQLVMLASESRPTVVEIFTENVGFYFPEGKLLYVRISNDGRMTYMERGDAKMVTVEKQLTREQMTRLKALLNAKSVRALGGIVAASTQPERRDYQTNLEFSIARDRNVQDFTLRGFEPDNGRPFPIGARELLCFIDELRNASYRVSSGCN